MRDYIYLCQTTPTEESCAQVGAGNYMHIAKLEADAYISQLLRTCGECPSGAYFKMVLCPHDFGHYLDIRFYYDDEDQTHVIYMQQLETGPCHWDEQAKKELHDLGYEIANGRGTIQHTGQ